MRFKRLGKTDMNVSVIAAGTWATGGGWGDADRKTSTDAIRAMLDNGVNFVDTAPVYGRGYAEEIVGDALAGVPRDSYYLATKVGLSFKGKDDPVIRDNGRANIMWEIDQSLRRLRQDYIDLYIVHWPDNHTDPAETMGALTDLVKAGKIRNIAVSNYDEQQITDAEQYGIVGAIQPPYSMVDRSAEKIMEFAKSHDIGTMTYGSLGAGILTGAIREMKAWGEDDPRANGFYPFFKEPQFSKVQQLLKVMDEIAADHHVAVGNVAINWSTQKDIVDTAIIGVRSPVRAKENCAAMDWELTEGEIATLDKAIAEYLG